MSQRSWIKWAVAAIWVVLAASAAYATDATVAGDAYVNSAHPSVNYGSLSNLHVNSNGTALLQFDLSSLPSGTIASQIGKATLKVFVNRINTVGSVTVQPITSAWSESAVTYATIPSLGTAVAAFTPTAAEQFVVVDITALVQSWITNPSSNFGIALSAASASYVFDSKENDETSHAAHLDITVTSQGATGATGATGAVGAVGPTGATGAQGIAGVAGPMGAIGATGAVGAVGPTGATGAQGISGATGATGPPVSFHGTWVNSTVYAVGDAVFENGTSYIALTSNFNVDPAIDVAGAGSTWSVLAAQGATGAVGAQGATGAQGIQGVAGATGATGAIGATGVTGPTGTTGATGTIGTVTTWASGTSYSTGAVVYYATNGSSYISLLDSNLGHIPPSSSSYWSIIAQGGATGATGATGDIGAEGPTGATGPTGPTGATSGGLAAVWSSSSVSYTTGELVTHNNNLFVALVDHTSSTSYEPGTNGGVGYWAGVSLGSGAAPAGIPYSITSHLVINSSLDYGSPTSSTQAVALGSITTAMAPTACTPSFTIYSYVPFSETFTLHEVTGAGLNTFTLGIAVPGASCTASSWSSDAAITCSAKASGTVPAGTLLTMVPETVTSSGTEAYMMAFSCQ